MDLDTWGVSDDSACFCNASGNYTALVPGDCNDNNAAVSPEATGSCSTPFDDNCDGDLNASDGQVRDLLLGWGRRRLRCLANECLCAPTGDYTALLTGDCDDSNPMVFPGALEGCDGWYPAIAMI